MKDNLTKQFNTTQENMLLNENDSNSVKITFLSAIISYLKVTKNNIRRFFIQKNEKSFIVKALEKSYYILLACKVSVIGTFLLTFGVIASVMSTFVSPTLGSFLSSDATFSSIIIVLSGLLLFTSKKTVEDAINSSVFILPLNIVYSQQGLISSNEIKINTTNAYSTAFFTGFIGGLFSIIFPAQNVILFLLSLLFTIFIFNRPECGVLIVSFMLPVFSEFYVIVYSLITLIALVYKYLLGKRHINFSVAEILSIISVIYMIIYVINFGNTAADMSNIVSFVMFFIVFVTTSNLVRSTAMYRRAIYIIIEFTRIYAMLLLANYICLSVFKYDVISNISFNNDFNGLCQALSSKGFITPVIAMAIPLNISYMLSVRKSKETAKTIIFLAMMLACTITVASYFYYLLILVSIITLLLFYKKRFLLFYPVAPFAAYALIKVINLLPSSYKNMRFSEDINPSDSLMTIIESGIQNVFGPSISSNVTTAIKNIGILCIVLLTAVFIYVVIVTVKSLINKKSYASKVRYMTVGQIIAVFVFIIISISTPYFTDIRIIYAFSVVFSLAYSSVRCYEADYIDENAVRDYLI